MYRRILIVLILLLLTTITQAQTSTPISYEIAQERIADAKKTGATTLDLSHVGLTELPTEIGELTELVTLDLSHNHLRELPPELTQLENLGILNLRYNELIKLPHDFVELSTLCHLDLRNNQIRTISGELIEAIEEHIALANCEQINMGTLDEALLLDIPTRIRSVPIYGDLFHFPSVPSMIKFILGLMLVFRVNTWVNRAPAKSKSKPSGSRYSTNSIGT